MPLPDGFVFTSDNLQDYVECERRFQLRSIDRLVWPAVEVEPYAEYEHMLEQDSLFHKLIQQHLNGIPVDQITPSLTNSEDLTLWWNNYLQSRQDGFLRIISRPDVQRYEDIMLSIPIHNYRLLTRYDLLLLQPGEKATIVHWMTGQARPTRKVLEDRLHAHIAPFVFAGASANVMNGKPIDPDQIELVYWFASQPEQPEVFEYSNNKYKEDEQILSSLTMNISQKNEPIFHLTPDVRRCLYCTYRSFCDRGTKPGEFKDWMDWLVSGASDAEIPDYNQLGESGY